MTLLNLLYSDTLTLATSLSYVCCFFSNNQVYLDFVKIKRIFCLNTVQYYI